MVSSITFPEGQFIVTPTTLKFVGPIRYLCSAIEKLQLMTGVIYVKDLKKAVLDIFYAA